MSFFEFPHTRTYDNDLGWLIKRVTEISDTVENFVLMNRVKYAEPLQWSITSQYEANTVVVDPKTGDAYMSVSPVPSGVSITNSEYWTPIFNYDGRITEIENLVGDLAASVIHVFPNVAAMKAEDLSSGTLCVTRGYYDAADGGAALYIISETGDALSESLENSLYAAAIISGPVNAKMFGLHGSDSNFNYTRIISIFDRFVTQGGGAIYFPPGTYHFKEIVPIPENTEIYGDGESSLIYGEMNTPYWGAAIGIAGSNVYMHDLAVGYVRDDDVLQPGQSDYTGAIGISRASYEMMKNPAGGVANYSSKSNVLIENIWSNSAFVFQAEPGGDGTYIIDNMTLRNIYAPRSLFSMTPQNDARGITTLKNVTAENIYCSILRVGAGFSAMDNITLHDVYCSIARIADNNITIANSIFDTTRNDPNITNQFYGAGLDLAVAANVVIDHCRVLGKTGGSIVTGIILRAAAHKGVKLSWVISKNFDTYNYQALSGSSAEFIGCDFSDDNNHQSVIHGKTLLTTGNYDNATTTLIDFTDLSPSMNFALASGFVQLSSALPNRTERSGYIVHLSGAVAKTGGNYAANDKPLTLYSNTRPRSKTNILVTVIDTANHASVNTNASIDTDGVMTIVDTGGLCSTISGNALVFDCVFFAHWD